MKNFTQVILATICSAGVLMAAPQQEAAKAPVVNEESQTFGNVEFTVGVAYRDFKRPKMKSINPGGFSRQLLLNGNVVAPTESNVRAALGTKDAVMKPVYFASYSNQGFSSVGKGSYGNGEQMAPALGISVGLWNRDAVTVDFVGNFQYYALDSKSSRNSAYTGSANSYFVTQTSSSSIVMPSFDAGTEVDSTSFSVTQSSKTKFDLDLYVFDAGLSLGYDFECGVRAYAASGLSLSIADIDSSTYSSLSSNKGKISNRHDSSNDVELNWGCYVAAGATYWFNETYGLSLECRYDDGFGDVGTKYVKQSLDTWGALVKLNVRF